MLPEMLLCAMSKALVGSKVTHIGLFAIASLSAFLVLGRTPLTYAPQLTYAIKSPSLSLAFEHLFRTLCNAHLWQTSANRLSSSEATTPLSRSTDRAGSHY